MSQKRSDFEQLNGEKHLKNAMKIHENKCSEPYIGSLVGENRVDSNINNWMEDQLIGSDLNRNDLKKPKTALRSIISQDLMQN